MAKDKGKFLEVFASKLGNVSKACEAAQISRQTYYDWMKDTEFSNKIEEVRGENSSQKRRAYKTTAGGKSKTPSRRESSKREAFG